MYLKKLLLASFFLLMVGMVSGQSWMAITSNEPTPASIKLIDGNASNSVLNVHLDGFNLNAVLTPRGKAFTVTVDESTPLLEKGMPDLPKVTASLIIPDQANMEVEVTASSYMDFPNIEIAPSKGNILRNTDPSTVPYTYNKVYELNSFYPSEQVGLRDPYIVRDYRGQTVVVSPFAYNPVTKTLRVYYDITLTVKENGISTINPFVRNQTSNILSSDFNNIYNHHFLNAGVQASRYTPVIEQGKMLIICYGEFIDEMQPFVEWKKQIGISVEIVDVATVGANSAAIKSYVAEYYANNDLAFLLLVGDHAQVPTVTTGDLAGPSDQAYGYLVGNDHYTDILVGRFSAEQASQVTTMVNRTIEYEKNPYVGFDWFTKGVGIASDQGPGDDNEYDYEHMGHIRTDLLGYTYTTVAEVYDGSQGGGDLSGNPTPQTVAVELNEGRSVVNYVGHGSDVSWGTSGFSNSDVNQLTNNNMWPFIFSVACVNGNFLSQTCFAEAWLRAANTNGPTGAIATMMSTINQSWNPPMEGEDEMDDILIESYSDNIKRTFAGITVNGCLKMNDTYGQEGFDMTDTWVVFGDPSVMVRTAMPENLVVNHEEVAFIGANQYVIECDVNDAIACITMDGEIMGTAIVANGEATIEIPTLSEISTFTLTVTAFNHIPYITEVEVIPLNGPYVTYNSNSINDTEGNNNQQLDYGETAFLNLGMENAGTEDALNASITISTTDPYTTIIDASDVYPLIPAGQIISCTDGFNISVASDVPEGHLITFNYVATVDTNVWDGEFTVSAHSVLLMYNGLTINDETGNSNGRVDPGETAILNLKVLNAGTAPAYDVLGILSSVDPYILINVDTVNYGTIVGYEILTAQFTITALPTTPMGYRANLEFNVEANSDFTAVGEPSFTVGQFPALIIDLDHNHNSGPIIRDVLENNGIDADYSTGWPLLIGPYRSLFVCLGTYPNNAVLSNSQGNALVNFMNSGGRVYMEGADTWETNPPTTAHAMFKIDGATGGTNDLGMINGIAGTFTEGITFNYYGDNNNVDHILPLDSAFAILENVAPQYNTTIAYNGGSYRTIGSSMEFAGVNYTVRNALMNNYIDFLGINSAPLLANFLVDTQVICEDGAISFTDYSAGDIATWNWTFPGGDPDHSTEQNPVVSYSTSGSYDVTLTIADSSGYSYSTTKTGYVTVEVCVATEDIAVDKLSVYPNPANDHFTLLLPGNKNKTEVRLYSLTGVEILRETVAGNQHVIDTHNLSTGVYLLNAKNNNLNSTVKLIIAK